MTIMKERIWLLPWSGLRPKWKNILSTYQQDMGARTQQVQKIVTTSVYTQKKEIIQGYMIYSAMKKSR